MTFELCKSEATTELDKASKESNFQFAADLIHFNLYGMRNSERREIKNFKHYVERVIYLSKDAVKVSTVLVWDQQLGMDGIYPTGWASGCRYS
ncbi:hypothetical protein [Paenibacillus macquariensis]|uniref:Uncharacterized protein n=1 Tax=Paenibacillus macquariensis TaxID=948756 RepID=A0ABY1KGI0_9BACL|nr:hypothetical protein [Paenibacillus macquariensis]MEC0093210.1 hypothetical protein [Paenibacillus macquariensis]OAB35047.1 hypothetical protein PMSM_10695 [Paenibacillus macquariensis subsp. macquariensis]SIR62821.1 hypothetical protein SAMN05421578_12439 [Paenibacillus macquariensis]